MARKLRKMLGDANAPLTIELMGLIGTQNRQTVCLWCLGYAESHILPIFEECCPEDMRPRNALRAARDYMADNVKFAQVKDTILNGCHAAARELDGKPAAQAAARACGQASSTVHTLTHSLGVYFYGAAAVAYFKLGTGATDSEHAAIAQEFCTGFAKELKAIALPDEPNPSSNLLKWHCM